MKVYDHPLSPYAMKIRISLYEKGLDFEKHEIHTEADAQELKKLNPRAEVPALADEGSMFYDSKVIAEYLEERYPETPLMPKDPAARAECRVLELFADTGLDAAVLALLLFKFFRPEMAEQDPEAMARAEASVREYYVAMERRLAAILAADMVG
jgi:glutathione S-transferase